MTELPTIATELSSKVFDMGRLDAVPDDVLMREVPLFATEGSVAFRVGGDVTRAFLESLPREWHGDHLVVDSSLVWLQKGQSLQSRWFHHEVYPGKTERAFGAANAERNVEHIACAMGAPSTREFLVGDVVVTDAEELGFDIYSTEGKDYPARHQLLREQRDAGHLQAAVMGMNVLHRYGWGSFQRVIATETSGYHFWIRASRGSVRPVVNGLRNVASPSCVGVWNTTVEI